MDVRLEEPVAISPSLLSFRFPRTEGGGRGIWLGADLRGGAGCSSSESLSVRSMTTGPEAVGAAGGARLGRGTSIGDNSRFTSRSPSESEESPMVIAPSELTLVEGGDGAVSVFTFSTTGTESLAVP